MCILVVPCTFLGCTMITANPRTWPPPLKTESIPIGSHSQWTRISDTNLGPHMHAHTSTLATHMYMHPHTCMYHSHVHLHTHAYSPTYMCTYTLVHTVIHMFTHTHALAHTCTFTCMHMHPHTCKCAYIYMKMETKEATSR